MMQRSESGRSFTLSYLLKFRIMPEILLRASSVSAGTLPSGGSITSDVRFTPSTRANSVSPVDEQYVVSADCCLARP
jgi:hypothetical protein